MRGSRFACALFGAAAIASVAGCSAGDSSVGADGDLLHFCIQMTDDLESRPVQLADVSGRMAWADGTMIDDATLGAWIEGREATLIADAPSTIRSDVERVVTGEADRLTRSRVTRFVAQECPATEPSVRP